MVVMKILIVEDEDVLAKVLKEKFEKTGFTTKIAKDGEEATKMAKVFKPDLIALDLMLPKKDGFVVLKELKRDDSLKEIPVVIISNLEEDENIKKGLQMGAVDYFVKSSHSINEIVDKLKSVFLKSK